MTAHASVSSIAGDTEVAGVPSRSPLLQRYTRSVFPYRNQKTGPELLPPFGAKILSSQPR